MGKTCVDVWPSSGMEEDDAKVDQETFEKAEKDVERMAVGLKARYKVLLPLDL